jgi:hypothetical protein
LLLLGPISELSLQVLAVVIEFKPLCSKNKLVSALLDSAICRLKRPIGYTESVLQLCL